MSTNEPPLVSANAHFRIVASNQDADILLIIQHRTNVKVVWGDRVKERTYEKKRSVVVKRAQVKCGCRVWNPIMTTERAVVANDQMQEKLVDRVYSKSLAALRATIANDLRVRVETGNLIAEIANDVSKVVRTGCTFLRSWADEQQHLDEELEDVVFDFMEPKIAAGNF